MFYGVLQVVLGGYDDVLYHLVEVEKYWRYNGRSHMVNSFELLKTVVDK